MSPRLFVDALVAGAEDDRAEDPASLRGQPMAESRTVQVSVSAGHQWVRPPTR